MLAPLMVQHALDQPVARDTTELENLDEYMISTYPEGDALKKESAWRFRNLISTANVESIDEPDRDQRISSYV